MHRLHFLQKFPISLDEAWSFFSSPTNLAKITPPTLNFKISYLQENKQMYPGQLIFYTIQPLWKLKLKWVTEITAVQPPFYFIDEQKFGPYSFWHHEHWFSEIPGGIQMDDLIYYKLPFGIFGKILNHYKVKKDLDDIFTYRQVALEKLLGSLRDQ